MKVAFKDHKLRELLAEGEKAHRFPLAVYQAFVDTVLFMEQALDERDLYKAPGFHMERLQGRRKGQYSVRLNKQFRLCFEIIKDQEGNLILLLEIVDYH